MTSPGPLPKTPLDRWTSQEERYQIADEHSARFKALIEAAQMLQEHPFRTSFKLISGADLVRCNRLPRYQEARPMLRALDSKMNAVFVSHRWLGAGHPDPDGRHLAMLKKQIDPNAFYWIDYCCMPQPPRTAEDEELFRETLSRLGTLLFESKLLVLRHKDDGYIDRAWCFFETFAGQSIVRSLHYVFEDVNHQADVIDEARRVVQETIMSGLPARLAVTNPQDREPIRVLIDCLRTFFELNVVMHYLRFAQFISDKRVLPFGEPPYYYLATWNLNRMMMWLFDKSVQHSLPLALLGEDEIQHNYFMRLSRCERFGPHNVDPQRLPKKVTRDQGGLTWMIMRKSAPLRPELESAHNLYFRLTSLVD